MDSQQKLNIMNQSPSKIIKLSYNVIDRSAKKIATLVKIAHLNFQIEQNHQQTSVSHLLQTPSGQLHQQYQIINYIIFQSRQLSKKVKAEQNKSEVSENDHDHSYIKDLESNKSEEVVNLEAHDPFITAKMYEKLFELRLSLFPLLHEFYKYLTGNQKTKKTKYDSLMNKIKKQIGRLDSAINQHPQIFHSQNNFLNIIIACQIFMACKFVFEEKFRKSKYSLFNKYQKISHRQQFIDVHGKSDLCQKQYVPSEFEQDNSAPSDLKEIVIPPEIIKCSNNVLSEPLNFNRNQLLYNYFRDTFTQTESKKQYFPYFWLMFNDLKCDLIQIVHIIQNSDEESGKFKLNALTKKTKEELSAGVDYGVIGLYQSQKDKKLLIRGLVCLGSKSAEQFEEILIKKGEISEIKMHKVNSEDERERKEVQHIWEHMGENRIQDQIKLISIQILV